MLAALLLLLAGPPAPAAGVPGSQPAEAATPVPDPLPPLGRKFREQRRQIRMDPSRAKELRKWEGTMHQAMAQMGELVAARHLTVPEVETLLGAPDEVLKEGEDHAGKPVPPGETHLAYWWRGGHDSLVFVVRQGVVVSSKWWLAHE